MAPRLLDLIPAHASLMLELRDMFAIAFNRAGFLPRPRYSCRRAVRAIMMFSALCTIPGCGQLRSPNYLYSSYPRPQHSRPHYESAQSFPPSRVVKASWYGDGFSGRRTASGERFDPNRLTAASKTLPIGSMVHVTNLENGRSVTVRINDRGPYVRGRSLDLSRGAARQIGLTHKGVGRVQVTPLPAHPSTVTAAMLE